MANSEGSVGFSQEIGGNQVENFQRPVVQVPPPVDIRLKKIDA